LRGTRREDPTTRVRESGWKDPPFEKTERAQRFHEGAKRVD